MADIDLAQIKAKAEQRLKDAQAEVKQARSVIAAIETVEKAAEEQK